jgi:hypothetical protein
MRSFRYRHGYTFIASEREVVDPEVEYGKAVPGVLRMAVDELLDRR